MSKILDRHPVLKAFSRVEKKVDSEMSVLGVWVVARKHRKSGKGLFKTIFDPATATDRIKWMVAESLHGRD